MLYPSTEKDYSESSFRLGSACQLKTHLETAVEEQPALLATANLLDLHSVVHWEAEYHPASSAMAWKISKSSFS